jgi:hypothetical protein
MFHRPALGGVEGESDRVHVAGGRGRLFGRGAFGGRPGQSTLGNIESTLGNIESTLGNIESTLGNIQSALGNAVDEVVSLGEEPSAADLVSPL